LESGGHRPAHEQRHRLDVAFFTDPWGVYIELTEGLDKL
jgi:hypothetical protein